MRVGQITNARGEPLKIQVSWLSEMGGSPAMEHILPALAEYKPRFAGMTGICAGNPAEVELGDLVVAVRAYEYDTGKISRDENGLFIQEHDVKTWSPNETIIQWVRGFMEEQVDLSRLVRPPSKRQQRDWLLSRAREANCRIAELPADEVEDHAPLCKELIHEMQAGPLPWLDSSTAILDCQRLEDLQPFPYKDRENTRIFPGVVGSGRAVLADSPFPRLKQPERKLIALDMEIATFYHAVAAHTELQQRCLAVKGVSDYADGAKNDTYREYCCKASAIYMYHFIIEYVNSELMTSMAIQSGSPRTSDLLPTPPIAASGDYLRAAKFLPIKHR